MTQTMAVHCATERDVVRPTQERMERDQFRQVGSSLKLMTTVQALYDAGDIGDDEIAAAERWRREYQFAELGVMDDRPQRQVSTEKGDIHTWMLSRGKCAARLRSLHEALGLCAQVRLEMMLAREMSFSAMARVLLPAHSETRARMKISAQCAFLLEQLACFYRRQKSAR